MKMLPHLKYVNKAQYYFQQLSYDYGYLRLEGYSRSQIFWLYAKDLFVFRFGFVCLVKGHLLLDGDPGDPEVGPQPNVYCVRCGKGW